MEAKDYFPHGKPKIIPPGEFFKAYECLREADYRDFWLRDIALGRLKAYSSQQKAHKEESGEDELYYLWCLCLQAEIHDYDEAYPMARQMLAAEEDRLKRIMKKDDLGSLGPTDKSL